MIVARSEVARIEAQLLAALGWEPGQRFDGVAQWRPGSEWPDAAYVWLPQKLAIEIVMKKI